MSDKKILITSALPYIHGIPHLGNIITSILPADVYYRYQRLRGRDTLYICGSDSHGTMHEIEAQKRGMETEDLVYESHKRVKSLLEQFNFDFSYYGITNSEENRETTEHIFKKIDENGYIDEREIDVTYCQNCEKYLADRWIEGECPECGGLARGDQCDDCGTLLDPKDIVDSYCIHCGKGDIDFRKSKHLFFRLQDFEDWLKDWVPGVAGNKITEKESFSWLDGGLRERCITRDASWGFSVPKEGYEDKVFYVWFDAPIGYIGATRTWAKENNEDWKKWWKNNDVKYVQFMGKDNVPFHTVLFPSVLKGTGENWHLADKIMAGAFLTAGDIKFSKSRGKGLNLESALKIRESDYWRFVLMSLYPRDSDIRFSWDIFQDKINNELTDSFGNYIHRTLKFLKDNFDSEIPDIDAGEDGFWEDVIRSVEAIERYIEEFRFKKAMNEVVRLSSKGNSYFQEKEPWKNIKDDEEGCKETMLICLNVVKSLAIVSEPFMPETAEKIWDFLNEEGKIHEEDWERAKKIDLRGKTIKDPEPLFEKVEKENIPKFTKEGGEKNMISFDEFKKLDIRIGEIKKAEDIEGSKNLFKLTVDVGEETKQSVAGFKGHYIKEELEGRKVPVLVNLEPSELMGVKSECMILAAVAGNKEPVVLEPERDLEAGTGIA